MLRLNIYILSLIFLLGFISTSEAQRVPHNELNIDYLCVFGNECSTSWGDDDFTQTIFLSLPDTIEQTFYIRVYDPSTGGNEDEQQGLWDTKTLISIYGGDDAYTNPASRNPDPVDGYNAGTLLDSKEFANEREWDKKWYIFDSFSSKDGELVDGRRLFKVIIEGIAGNDGNMLLLEFSHSEEGANPLIDSQIFAYEWTFRLPNVVGTLVYTFPFHVDEGIKNIIQYAWDFDDDNVMALNTPSRPGLAMYGMEDWNLQTLEVAPEGRRIIDFNANKRWTTTAYGVPPDDVGVKWQFEIRKGNFINNDIALYITDDKGNPLPMYSIPPQRRSYALSTDMEGFLPGTMRLTRKTNLKERTVLTGEAIILKGGVLTTGTILPRGTLLQQDIITDRGTTLRAGTVLDESVILGENITLKTNTRLGQGTILGANSMIYPRYLCQLEC